MAMPPHPAVVRVTAEERVGTSHGSGTLVEVSADYGLVVTNWHVIRDAAGEITVAFPDGFRTPGKLLKADKDWDLAALLILRPNVPPVRIASKAPRPGDVLTIAGYGKGDYRAATGRCVQYVAPGANHPYEMLEVSVQARNGDSGGPILNDSGELAGVLFGAGGGSTSGSYCGRVRWFLESVLPILGVSEVQQMDLAKTIANVVSDPPSPPSAPRQSLVPVPPPPEYVASQQLQEVIAEPSVPHDGTRRRPYYSTPPDRLPTANSPSLQSPGIHLPFSLRDLLGTTPLERGKLALAAIGCLAILSKLAKVLGS